MGGATGGPGPAVRVFLLDDHELMRRGLRQLLEEAEGVDVVGEAGSAEVAKRRILALRPDVALLDIKLDQGSGVEVCRAVRDRDPTIRALMITTFDDEDARKGSALAGAAGVVLKDIRGDTLVESVRRVAAGQELPSAAAAPAGAADFAGDPLLARLTPQERRVLDLVVEGLTNREVGAELGIAEKTVRNHVTNVLGKLGLARRTQAAVYVVQHRS